MSRWFRWYAGTSEDGKFRFVARNASVTVATVIGVWAALLEDASSEGHRGVVTRNEDFFAAVLDLEDCVMEAILSAMESVGMISVGHGAITITNWKERQFETDTTDPTNAERQKRYRQKRNQDASETHSNGTVTEEKRPDPDPEREESKILPLEQVAARESDVKEIVKSFSGLGRGGVVSPAARLKVAARLSVMTVDPIVRLYEAWGPSQKALDPDGHFIAAAEKFWRDASAEVRAACMPLVAEPPIPIQRPTARASSALANSKLAGGRHGLSRH